MDVFDVHGVILQLIGKDRRFLEFVRSHYSFFLSNKKDIDIKVDFQGILPFYKQKKTSSTGYKRWGSDVYISSNALLIQNSRKNVYIHFDRIINLQALYYLRPDQTIRQILPGYLSPIYKLYQVIMREIVHFPIFYKLERKGIYLMHASAVERDGRGVVFSGLNGSGKSTLSIYLVLNHGFKYISDNFLLFDNRRIFCFPEVIRVAPADLTRLGIEEKGRIVYGKYQILPPDERISMSVFPEFFFLTCIGERFELSSITEEEFVKKVMGFHNYLKEFHWHSFMGLYRMFDRGEFSFKLYEEKLRSLVKGKKIYELTLPYNETLEHTARRLEDAVFNS